MAEIKDNLLSIIVPVFNGELHIRRCIDSIRKQNYSFLEIIIIDDGSTDNTYNICNEVAKIDSRIKLMHKKNGGVSSARNAGIDLASGAFMMFVDSDDTIETNYCMSFMNKLDLIQKHIIVFCGLSEYTADSNSVAFIGSGLEKEVILEPDSLVDIWKQYLWNPPVNKVYLTEVIKRNNIRFDVGVANGEDWLFNNAYVRHLKPQGYFFISETSYNYYYDPSPWRHCTRDEYYEINKKQVVDFMATLEFLNLSNNELWKFEKCDIDFIISEIRYNARKHDFDKAKYLYGTENIQVRVKAHKNDYSRLDYYEFACGSLLLIYCWENIRQFLGNVRKKINE